MATTNFCARHPNNPSNLRCGKCDTLICPRCIVQSPVGARCPDCGKPTKSPVYNAGPMHLAKAIGAALGIAIAGGLVIPLLHDFIPFAILYILGLAGFGYVMGEGVGLAANRKRGRTLQLVAVGGILIAFGLVVYLGGFGTRMGLFDVAAWGLAGYVAYLRLR